VARPILLLRAPLAAANQPSVDPKQGSLDALTALDKIDRARAAELEAFEAYRLALGREFARASAVAVDVGAITARAKALRARAATHNERLEAFNSVKDTLNAVLKHEQETRPKNLLEALDNFRSGTGLTPGTQKRIKELIGSTKKEPSGSGPTRAIRKVAAHRARRPRGRRSTAKLKRG
jgi:hypothetical protein